MKLTISILLIVSISAVTSLNAGPWDNQIIVECDLHGQFEGFTTTHFSNTDLQGVCHTAFGVLVTETKHTETAVILDDDRLKPECFNGHKVVVIDT